MTNKRESLNNSSLSGDLGFEEDRSRRTIQERLREEARVAGMPPDDSLIAKRIDLKYKESFWKNPPDIVIEGSG